MSRLETTQIDLRWFWINLFVIFHSGDTGGEVEVEEVKDPSTATFLCAPFFLI